jgi:hypothetical protein
MMANNFSLDNLATDPNFDLIQVFKNNSTDDSNMFFNLDNSDSPYSSSNFNCKYYDIDSACTKLNDDKRISIISINIQSLSAKYCELLELVNIFSEKNCCPDFILLQEIWQVTDPKIFSLPNYQPLIFKCRERGQGGGVGIFVKKGINSNAILMVFSGKKILKPYSLMFGLMINIL